MHNKNVDLYLFLLLYSSTHVLTPPQFVIYVDQPCAQCLSKYTIFKKNLLNTPGGHVCEILKELQCLSSSPASHRFTSTL